MPGDVVQIRSPHSENEIWAYLSPFSGSQTPRPLSSLSLGAIVGYANNEKVIYNVMFDGDIYEVHNANLFSVSSNSGESV